MAEINQLSIRFDEKRFFYDLAFKLTTKLFETVGRLEVEMQFLAKSRIVKDSIKSSYDKDIIGLVEYGLGLIEVKVGSTSWKAFLENYGTGSKMDKEFNPFIHGYWGEKYWNPLRLGKTVVGREKGWYKTLDWETNNPVKEVWRYSEGNYAGENLEEIKKTMPNGGKTTMFKPQEPNYFMNYAFLNVKENFEKSVIEALKSMNLNDYLITGK